MNETDRPSNDTWRLLTLSLVSSLVMLDSNVVAVSLPSIGRSFGATFTSLQWVITAYVLTYTALLLAAGNFADLVGRRKAMVLGLVIFSVSSAGCGFATSIDILNAARAVQGVGAALLLTASLAILSNAFAGAKRSHALAFWGASLGIALAVGPIVGGAINNWFGWRWAFLINLPIGVALLFATSKVVQESTDPHASRLDFAGIATFSPGLMFLIWALIEGNDLGWASLTILFRLSGAFGFFAAFVVVESTQSRSMVDFALFRNRTFLGATFAMLGYGGSVQVMVFFLPQYLQNAFGFGSLAAGCAMIPFALPMVLAPRIVGKLAARFSGRALLTAGLLIAVAGNLALCLAAQQTFPYGVFALAMLIAGCGAGILNGQTVKVLQSAVPEERAGMASGLASTTRYLGILISVAALGAILSNAARGIFEARALAGGLPNATIEFASKRLTAGDMASVLALVPEAQRVPLRALAETAYSGGFAAACLFAAFWAAGSCAAAYLMIERKEAEDQHTRRIVGQPCMAIDCRDPI